MKSFLQTTQWLEFQKSLGRKVWRYDAGGITANIIQHDLPFGMNYLYIPHGPVIDFELQRAPSQKEGALCNEFVAYIKELAREEKSIFVKMEPLDDKVPEVLHQFKFKKSAKEIQPKRSVIIDLTQSEEELLAQMHHKTRYNIRVAEKHGIVAKPSDRIDIFWKLLQKTSKRDRFASHHKSYYENLLKFFSADNSIRADLILALKDERPISDVHDHALAGAIILTAGDTAYYMHGASDHDARALMAPYALHWDIIKYLKQQGVAHYDLWGIDHQRWPGVTRFKLGWLGSPTRATPEAPSRREHVGSGGRQIEYPGTFDLSIRSFWFLVYKLLRKIF